LLKLHGVKKMDYFSTLHSTNTNKKAFGLEIASKILSGFSLVCVRVMFFYKKFVSFYNIKYVGQCFLRTHGVFLGFLLFFKVLTAIFNLSVVAQY
jgi:hypothetical protein